MTIQLFHLSLAFDTLSYWPVMFAKVNLHAIILEQLFRLRYPEQQPAAGVHADVIHRNLHEHGTDSVHL